MTLIGLPGGIEKAVYGIPTEGGVIKKLDSS
jgi:hypothetical protein